MQLFSNKIAIISNHDTLWQIKHEGSIDDKLKTNILNGLLKIKNRNIKTINLDTAWVSCMDSTLDSHFNTEFIADELLKAGWQNVIEGNRKDR